MNKKTELVFVGFLELTHSEKSDLIEAIKEYYEKSEKERGLTESQTRKAILGPLDRQVCPCCGR